MLPMKYNDTAVLQLSKSSLKQDLDEIAKRCWSFLIFLASFRFIYTESSPYKTESESKPSANVTNDPLVPQSSHQECLVVVDVQPQFWTSVPSIRQDFPDFERSMQHAIDTFRKNDGIIVWIRCDYTFDKSKWLSNWSQMNPTKQHVNTCEVKNADKNGWPSDSRHIKWEPFATPDMNNPNEYLICKSNWNGVTRTALTDILKSHQLKHVHVAGLITSICVQATAYGLFEAGFDVTLLEHCCGDRGKDRHEASLLLYKDYMYKTIDNQTHVESIFPQKVRHDIVQDGCDV